MNNLYNTLTLILGIIISLCAIHFLNIEKKIFD
jgi:hypothetical protein